jgi:hypothetical protein
MGLTIEQGEKFACVVFSGLNLALNEVPDPAEIGFGCWSSSNLPFKLDTWWRRQLGDIVSDQLERLCSFVLLAKQPGGSDDAFGEESRILRNRVLFLTWGLAVTAGVPSFSLARLIFGGVFRADQPKLAFAQFAQFYQTLDADKPCADLTALQSASFFSHHLEEIESARQQDLRIYQRLESGVHALVSGFQSSKPSVRLHQFVRAIEAFLPASVQGRKDFADHAAVFLSNPEEQDTRIMLLQMYDLRSAAEHHRLFDERALPDVADPELAAMRRTRQAEAFARELYRRFLATEPSHLSLFQDETSLEEFWEDRARVRASWGQPLNLNEVK